MSSQEQMMSAVDSAMDRIFGRKQQTREEIQEQLERAEDEFIARKEAEAE